MMDAIPCLTSSSEASFFWRLFYLLCPWLTSSSEADRVRQEYESSNAKLSKIQSTISTLSEKLKHDFGKLKSLLFFCGAVLACSSYSFLSAYELKSVLNIAGAEKEFYSFYGRCFESKENKLFFIFPLFV